MERLYCWCTTGINTWPTSIKYINDIFLFVDTAFLGNYGDTTLYSIQNNPKSNQAIINYNFTTLQKWFYENYFVLNQSKYFYMCLG